MRISAKDTFYIQPKVRHGHWYTELMHNLSVKARPEGGALRSIIERYISDVDYKLRSAGKDNEQIYHISTMISRRFSELCQRL